MKFSFPCFNCSSSTSDIVGGDKTRHGRQTLQSFRVFSYKELEIATHGFRSSNKIGEGGFGSVYMGQFRDGTVVAVKVLSVELESMRGEREFIAEIAALSNIKHENLVTFQGCCIEGAGRYVVYEYMENNSLSHTLLGDSFFFLITYLYSVPSTSCIGVKLFCGNFFLINNPTMILTGGEQNRTTFSWELRRDISLGVARGLIYLHEEVQPHIVHRDIKASNILLDRDFIPKISDFGLAKLFTNNTSHISTRVAGTLGYLAPEYAISGHLTRKSDVYSFGVLLLEIISGRSVVKFDLDRQEHFLVQEAWEMYKSNNPLQLVDPTLKGNFPEEEVFRFLKVGMLCVQEISRLRPRMPQAFKMLSNEVDIKHVEISQPGLVGDLMAIKINQSQPSEGNFSKASTSISTESSHSTAYF